MRLMNFKYLFFIFSIFLFTNSYPMNQDSILKVLDESINKQDFYSSLKIEKINTIHKKLNNDSLSPKKIYNLNQSLFELYKAFISDSAIFYINKNIEISKKYGYDDLELSSRLEYAILLSACGLFMESMNQINNINKNDLKKYNLLGKYYFICNHIFREYENYSMDKSLKEEYSMMANSYKDSLYMVLETNDEDYLSNRETELRIMKKYNEALQINDKRLSLTIDNTPSFAIVMYCRALIYDKMGNNEEFINALAISSISDIRNATKDHASLWMLAEALLKKGDIERAYKYMNISWNDTKFYNSRLRAWQSSNELSLINNTYRLLLQKSNNKMRNYVILVSTLSFILAISLVIIYFQIKRLTSTRRKLIEINHSLADLNEELKIKNIEINKINEKLNESNLIKDEYIMKFTKLCSTYINKLDDLRKTTNKMIKGNKIQELLRLTCSESFLEQPLNELYANFDSSFLNLFPNFIDKFNELLDENEQIIPKMKGQLNTELRIFALIRLGINDSSQIAEFLRYSVNTIYNYRAKVKNKAKVARNEFEDLVCKIK